MGWQHTVPGMAGRPRLLSFVWQAPLAVAIVAGVWFALEASTRLIGLAPTVLLSLVGLGASLGGLAWLWRR